MPSQHQFITNPAASARLNRQRHLHNLHLLMSAKQEEVTWLILRGKGNSAKCLRLESEIDGLLADVQKLEAQP